MSNATLSVLNSIDETSTLTMPLSPAVRLLPGDTAELMLLVDFADSATAANLVVGLESVTDIVAHDANTGNPVAVSAPASMPLRTAPCRIDAAASALAVANLGVTRAGVNTVSRMHRS